MVHIVQQRIWVLQPLDRPMSQSVRIIINIKFIIGGRMRNYSFINGTRFAVVNLFRSLRFDIDHLDLSWVDDTKPGFVRGLRK
jgi:hypothetical protein